MLVFVSIVHVGTVDATFQKFCIFQKMMLVVKITY